MNSTNVCQNAIARSIRLTTSLSRLKNSFSPPKSFANLSQHASDSNCAPSVASAAETDLNLALEAEAPQVQLGRARGTRQPVFLFPAVEAGLEVEWQSQSTLRYHGRIADLTAEVTRSAEEGKTTLFVMPSLGNAERIVEILNEYKIETRLAFTGETSDAASFHPVVVTVGRLSGGFELPQSRLIVHVEADVFDEAVDSVERRPTGAERYAANRKAKRKSKAAAFLSDFRDLKPDDYVVHIDHGIARFGGLQTLDLGPRTGEFMLLFYADEAKLYVPVERLDLVQRYSSAEGHQPQLDRLGGLGWQKTKAKAQRAMRDMADELLRLYAERKLVGGYAFAADTPWQQEFEDGFQFVLTPDQETAIEDVKKDMEEPVPMDRLLCGDVGYGKTEVAMRAAFKSVMEGKQAAILTPTTVLAYQHYDTFRNRFAPFPVKVELLSRFRSIERTEGGCEESRDRRDRRDHRHAPHTFKRRSLQGSRTRSCRRRTAFWSCTQRTAEAFEETRRRVDAFRNADSTHAQHVAQWHARHVAHRNATTRSTRYSDSGGPVLGNGNQSRQ